MNREDFEILEKDIIYFDNAATTLKPKVVIKKIEEYYNNYPANAHRGDYKIAYRASEEFENTRTLIKTFINAKNKEEIIFTSNATDALNKIILGNFKKNDEVLITRTEHASNILPWQTIGADIKYIELTKDYEVTLENIKKIVTNETKVISLAYITNTIGDTRPIKKIIEFAHKHNIIVIVDAAQAIGHMKVDVQELDVDYLAFSAHKMCGPTGVGVLYGKKELLENMKPIITGGGMNISFDEQKYAPKKTPYKFESGTQNIAGIIAFGEAIKYLNSIGLENINKYEKELKKYALEKLPNIKIYNRKSDNIILFNVDNIFSQDVAMYLDKYNICIRSGSHCAKLFKEKNTCRISFYFYNTKEEIDTLVKLLESKDILKEVITF